MFFCLHHQEKKKDFFHIREKGSVGETVPLFCRLIITICSPTLITDAVSSSAHPTPKPRRRFLCPRSNPITPWILKLSSLSDLTAHFPYRLAGTARLPEAVVTIATCSNMARSHHALLLPTLTG